MSDIQVEKEIVMRPINTIKPYVRNPRRNEKTVELLVKLIPKVGFNVPLVIDEKGIIVKGHARFTAAIRLGMTELPCIITHADEEAIKADRITDNKISEYSEWVTDELLEEVNSIDFDLSDIGFPKVDFGDMPNSEAVRADIASSNAELPTEVTSKTLSEADKERLYQEFLKKQEQEKKTEELKNSALASEPYYKVVCDKCGTVMFFKESEFNKEV